MGFHACEFCDAVSVTKNKFNHLSTGDVNLTFANGHRWVMPDMILHYLADHDWLPPQEFINDVLGVELADSGRIQTRGIMMSIGDIYQGQRIGYLVGSFERGVVPDGFAERLELLMKKAGDMGYRAQTKGLVCR